MLAFLRSIRRAYRKSWTSGCMFPLSYKRYAEVNDGGGGTGGRILQRTVGQVVLTCPVLKTLELESQGQRHLPGRQRRRITSQIYVGLLDNSLLPERPGVSGRNRSVVCRGELGVV